MSDSSYKAATRHRKPHSVVDDEWAADTLSDDEVNCHQQEAKIQSLLGDLDVDSVVVSTGHSDSAQNDSDRRRREEGRWNDFGLDMFDNAGGNDGNGRGASDNDNGQNQ